MQRFLCTIMAVVIFITSFTPQLCAYANTKHKIPTLNLGEFFTAKDMKPLPPKVEFDEESRMRDVRTNWRDNIHRKIEIAVVDNPFDFIFNKATSAEDYRVGVWGKHYYLNTNFNDNLSARDAKRAAAYQAHETGLTSEYRDRASAIVQNSQGYSDTFASFDRAQLEKSYALGMHVLAEEYNGNMQIQEDDKEHNIVIKSLNQNELTLEDLLNFIDPWDPNDYGNFYDTFYAAEVLSYYVDNFSKEMIEEGFLYEAQQRVLYRLESIAKVPVTVPELTKVQVLGTLRILLLKIHRAYEKFGLGDPLVVPFNPQKIQAFTPTPKMLSSTALNWDTSIYDKLSDSFYSELSSYKDQMDSDRGWIEKNLPEVFPFDFVDGVASLAKMVTEGSSVRDKRKEIQTAAYLLGQYAAMYSVLRGKKQVELVTLFDDGSSWAESTGISKKKWNRYYASFQLDILTVMYETAQYGDVGQTYFRSTYKAFRKLALGDSYSLQLRVNALEALSLMAAKENEEKGIDEIGRINGIGWITEIGSINEVGSSLSWRSARIVPGADREKYLHVIAEFVRKAPNVGLDSKQTVELRDNLGYIFGKFAPGYGGSLAQDSLKQAGAYSLVEDNCHGFYFDGTCITIRNRPDSEQVRWEYNEIFLDAAFMIVGWSAIGRGVGWVATKAMRFFKGFVKAFPKALKVTSRHRSKVFWAAMSRESRYAEEVSKVTSGANATTLVRHTEGTPKPVASVADLSQGSISSETAIRVAPTEVPASSPTYTFMQWQPEFDMLEGTSTFSEPITSANWNRFTKSFVGANGKPISWTNLSAAAKRQVGLEQSMFASLTDAAHAGEFQLFIPFEEKSLVSNALIGTKKWYEPFAGDVSKLPWKNFSLEMPLVVGRNGELLGTVSAGSAPYQSMLGSMLMRPSQWGVTNPTVLKNSESFVNMFVNPKEALAISDSWMFDATKYVYNTDNALFLGDRVLGKYFMPIQQTLKSWGKFYLKWYSLDAATYEFHRKLQQKTATNDFTTAIGNIPKAIFELESPEEDLQLRIAEDVDRAKKESIEGAAISLVIQPMLHKTGVLSFVDGKLSSNLMRNHQVIATMNSLTKGKMNGAVDSLSTQLDLLVAQLPEGEIKQKLLSYMERCVELKNRIDSATKSDQMQEIKTDYEALVKEVESCMAEIFATNKAILSKSLEDAIENIDSVLSEVSEEEKENLSEYRKGLVELLAESKKVSEPEEIEEIESRAMSYAMELEIRQLPFVKLTVERRLADQDKLDEVESWFQDYEKDLLSLQAALKSAKTDKEKQQIADKYQKLNFKFSKYTAEIEIKTAVYIIENKKEQLARSGKDSKEDINLLNKVKRNLNTCLQQLKKVQTEQQLESLMERVQALANQVVEREAQSQLSEFITNEIETLNSRYQIAKIMGESKEKLDAWVSIIDEYTTEANSIISNTSLSISEKEKHIKYLAERVSDKMDAAGLNQY